MIKTAQMIALEAVRIQAINAPVPINEEIESAVMKAKNVLGL